MHTLVCVLMPLYWAQIVYMRVVCRISVSVRPRVLVIITLSSQWKTTLDQYITFKFKNVHPRQWKVIVYTHPSKHST